MPIEIDLALLPPAARRVLDPTAPPRLRELAARGSTPGVAGTADLLSIVVLLSRLEGDPMAAIAHETLQNLAPPVLASALTSDLPGAVIDELARNYLHDTKAIDRFLSMPRIAAETVVHLASVGDEQICELIAINETRLLANPEVIEKLYMNPRARLSTADRVVELAGRNNLELHGIPAYREVVAALQEQLIPEPMDEPLPDDIAFVETAVEAAAIDNPAVLDELHEHDEEGQETVTKKALPLHAMLASLPISGKIRRAMLGTAAERALLMRDTNKLVAVAAIRSPQIQEPEVVRVSSSRQVHEDVLRTVAQNGEWLKNHQIKLNLVGNPRTPLSFSMRLIPHLREGELKALSKSRDIGGAIKIAVKQQLARKQKPDGK